MNTETEQARQDFNGWRLEAYQTCMGQHLDHIARESNRQKKLIALALIELGAGRQDKARDLLKQLTGGNP